MELTINALEKGYQETASGWVFRFGEGYELYFELLPRDEQMYVSIYKDRILLTNKVIVKPGKI